MDKSDSARFVYHIDVSSTAIIPHRKVHQIQSSKCATTVVDSMEQYIYILTMALSSCIYS